MPLTVHPASMAKSGFFLQVLDYHHSLLLQLVFVEQVRIDFARKLLEETDVPLKTVAFRCGFHNATQMRMIFTRRMDITPRLYRERFRAEDVPKISPAGTGKALSLVPKPQAA